MRILSFDTASRGCSVALWEDGVRLYSLRENIDRGQAQRLPLMVQEVLKETGLSLSDVDLLLTNLGPGSFTGIRIALSFGYGLSAASRIPLQGYDSFCVALAGYDTPPSAPHIIVLDAKRRDLYVRFGGSHEILSLEPQALAARVGEESYGLLGDGVDQVLPFLPHCAALESPQWLGADALARAHGIYPQFILNPQPLYVREADVSQPKIV